MKDVNKVLLAAALAAAVTGAGKLAQADPYDAPVSIDLRFIFHIDDGIAEQDVFIEREPGSGQVFRPTKAEQNLDQPLYAAAEPVEHTPFQPDNLGPWKKGRALGITLKQWFEAQGKGRYICNDGQGELRIDFSKLAADAVYTLWHDFYAWPPTEPFIGTYDLPIGSRDGSESVFRTDRQGNAVVERRFKPCLQLSGEHLAAELAIAWHSNAQTYGPLPGEFATHTHVHMYVGLPKRSGI